MSKFETYNVMTLILTVTFIVWFILDHLGYGKPPILNLNDLSEIAQMCIDIGGEVTVYKDGISCSLVPTKD